MPLPWPRRPLLIGAGAVGSVALSVAAAHQAAAAVYGLWQPSLQRVLSQQLGQPVRLGAFAGLRPWGLRLGPSRVEPTGSGRSQLRAAAVQISLAPLASLRQGAPTLAIDLIGGDATLVANAKGSYWTLPRRRQTQRPPRLALRLRLLQPAAVAVPRSASRYSLAGALDLQLHRSALRFDGVLRPLNGNGGSLRLRADGQWPRQQWQLQLGARRLQLAALAGLLPGQPRRLLPGSLSGELQLRRSGHRRSCQGRLELQGLLWTAGGIERAQLRCDGQSLALQPTAVRWGTWQASARGRLQLLASGQLQLDTLRLQRGSSWIDLRGPVGAQAALQSRLQIDPRDLPQGQRLPAWLQRNRLQGELSATGPWRTPTLRLGLRAPTAALLGPWQAALVWSGNVLRLQHLRSDQLTAQGRLPLRLQPGRGMVAGPLQLQLLLHRYPLQRLQPVLGSRLSGVLTAQGTISGPLNALIPDLSLELNRLGAGALQLNEVWRGHWLGASGGGGQLQLQAQAPAPAADLQASLNRGWMPMRVTLRRGQGQLLLQGQPQAYRWSAQELLLDGLGLRLGPRAIPQPLSGRLSGSGDLSLQPLGFSGQAQLARPALLGLRLQQARLQGRYRRQGYQVSGTLNPTSEGRLALEAQGRWRGPFKLAISARGLNRDTLQQLAYVWPQWQGRLLAPGGQARDLGTLMIDTLGESLQQQLEALAAAKLRLQNSEREGSSALQQRLRQLDTRLDADITLQGPTLKRAQLDLAARGHLWKRSGQSDQALSADPFEIRLEGPVLQGRGTFNLQQLPLTLLALLTPVPDSLRGALSLQGRYGLGGRSPELNLKLGLERAELGGRELSLSRGSVVLQGQSLNLDLALQAEGASSSLDLAGMLPLDPTRQGLELRLASRGDGLRFLTAAAEPELTWSSGSADLQLLLRGSVRDPIANGFLRIRDGQLKALNQTVEDLEATVLFDFEQLLVQELKARVGSAGTITGSGHLGLVNPTATQPALSVALNQVPFALPRIQAIADGNLAIGGSLRDLQMGGEVTIARGSINAQRGRLVAAKPGRAQTTPRQGVSQLLQENWDFQSPLLLVGSEVQTNSGRDVLQAVPRFKPLGFNDLRLKLGPDLRIVIPNAASFKTAGLLRLSGRLDPSLRARGVLRLLQGRLNLFTTTFSLDPDAPNVAIFTPALGLVPYLDIAMRTRVSDNLAVAGLGSAGAQSLAEIEAQGGPTSLNQLNLVRITVSVSGPADRLAQNIRLRSSPPLPESRLIALIGGNSLAALGGAGAGAAIATVVGQTLLSPVLGGLSDAFGQRLSFGLYPTYLYPNVTNDAVLQSRRLAPQLVLGSEIGVDVTERFNVSVLTAPNRSDVPQQLNLNLRATDLINLQGSVDSQGAWQTQMQLFFRF
ncbi:MAG: translocation/assembly module TamB domain-containing protein [Cyanobacteriota bacterium]|nr:translocation/assembly module TamB domain-containing protein [Cyanobacteriota bacterium]